MLQNCNNLNVGDDIKDRLLKAAEQGTLVIINRNKVEQMLATIGIQPSELSCIVDLAKNIVTYSNSKVNACDKNSQNKFSTVDDSSGEITDVGEKEVRTKKSRQHHGCGKSTSIYTRKGKFAAH